MKPLGPYRNKWANYPPLFIVRDANGIIRTVFVGQKIEVALMHPSLRDAKAYLKDNGFLLTNKEQRNDYLCK